MLYGIATATSALLLTAVLAALLRVPALRLGFVGRRRQRRKVPLVGGVAVVVVTCAVVGVGEWTGVGGLLVAGVGVAGLGVVADLWRVRARVLFVGTAVAAACVMPYEEIGVAGGVLAVGWVAGVALGFRALDHADALAGTVGVVTAFGVAVCAAVEVMDGLAVLLSVLAAALTGFLMHNWPPARVGLGSGGALFAGFVLAVAAVLTRAGHGFGDGVAVLFALSAVVGADVLLVTRFGHRLRRLGITAQGLVVLLGAGAFSGVLVAVLVHLGWVAGSGALWVAAGALVVVCGLLRLKPSSASRPVSSQVRAQLRVRNG